jgi:RNA polymerase sigma-70 factor, ECF subfamily
MSSSFAVRHADVFLPGLETQEARFTQIYNSNCHRIYSLAFWMTDHEQVAEQIAPNAFLRAFKSFSSPSPEQIDQAFLTEVREIVSVDGLTLRCQGAAGKSLRGNVKRIHLERAVVQLPSVEKLIFLLHDVEGYEHPRIARLLGITEDDCQVGLHQARLRVRELVARLQ